MKIYVTILFCFICFHSTAQADFLVSSGTYRQSLAYFTSNANVENKNLSLFFGLGASYQINQKLSINQLVTYHVNDKQIPDVNGIDQKQPLHYLNMEFLLNYKVSYRLKPSVGFRLGSLFLTENFIEPTNSVFLETTGNDIVMMVGLRGNLTHNVELYIKHDIVYLQTQEYFGWFSASNIERKNRIFYIGLSYAPFKKKSK